MQGLEETRRSVRSGRARLVVVAGDVAPGQRPKLERTLAGRPVPVVILGTRESLGTAVGARAPLSAVAVTDPSLAREIGRRLSDGEGRGEDARRSGGSPDACG